MLQDSAIISEWGEIETIVHILPIDNLSSPSCDYYHALQRVISHDGCGAGLNSITLESGDMFSIARCQVLVGDLLDIVNSSRLPFHHRILATH